MAYNSCTAQLGCLGGFLIGGGCAFRISLSWATDTVTSAKKSMTPRINHLSTL
jgi:hypothetical protein